MKIETKRCSFCPITQVWTLKSFIIEVNSLKEFRKAWKDFSAEVQRFQQLTASAAGGSDGQR